MRRFLFAAVLVLGLPSIHLFAQAAPKRTPVSGVVLNAGGRPLANAQVILQRHTFKLDSEGVEILAHGQTDTSGRFAFGDVALKSQVDFPLETGVSIEFVVMIDGKRPTIDSVQFTAPRTDSTVSSIAAEIWVH